MPDTPARPHAPIPPDPFPATSLAQILATPEPQWFCIARRGWGAPGEPLPPWEYHLGGGDSEARVRELALAWSAIHAGLIFAPQRRLDTHLEWLAIRFPI